MIRHHFKPVLMGAAMGAMMLWMAHGVISGETSVGLGAALVFVGAHVLAFGLVAAVAFFGARLHPRLRGVAARLPRPKLGPTLGHAAVMLGSASVAALLIHVLHGAP